MLRIPRLTRWQFVDWELYLPATGNIVNGDAKEEEEEEEEEGRGRKEEQDEEQEEE